jgi:hypothetical protein
VAGESGANVRAGFEGPGLHDLHKSDERIHQQIIAGVKGEMPSFAKKERFGRSGADRLSANVAQPA